ncbi:MAG: DUF1858 domain-containing protein [Chloroflexota bacterium]
MMAVLQLDPQNKVSETLRVYPQTARVFIELRTDCVGCIAARFCTLRDVALDYNLDLEELLSELRAAIQSPVP